MYLTLLKKTIIIWICGIVELSGIHLQWIFIPHKIIFSSGQMQLWMHESLDIGHFERTIVWSWTHEIVFLRSWSDYRAFKTAYVQTFVRSNLPMSSLPCVQSYLWSDYRAFKVAYVQTIVRSFFSRPCNFVVRSFRSGTSTWVWLRKCW